MARGSFYYHKEQNVGRKKNMRGVSGEISDTSEEHMIGN